MDCVVGGQKKGKSILLVLSERKSREELIFKMKGKTRKCIKKAIDSLERKHGYNKFGKISKTIAVDNGGEFWGYKGIKTYIKRREG